MNRVLTSLLVAMATVTVAHAANVATPSVPALPGSRAGSPQGANSDYAVIDVGSQAPDFTYEAVDGWLRLHDLRLQGHVLLVIAPDEATLTQLQRERETLHRLSVLPVAVVDQRASACRALAGRLGLDFPVLPDPRRVIGEQFNALDPNSRADAPAWFVLDQKGRVHDLGRQGWPNRPWAEVSARALGLALPGDAASASHRAR